MWAILQKWVKKLQVCFLKLTTLKNVFSSLVHFQVNKQIFYNFNRAQLNMTDPGLYLSLILSWPKFTSISMMYYEKSQRNASSCPNQTNVKFRRLDHFTNWFAAKSIIVLSIVLPRKLIKILTKKLIDWNVSQISCWLLDLNR